MKINTAEYTLTLQAREQLMRMRYIEQLEGFFVLLSKKKAEMAIIADDGQVLFFALRSSKPMSEKRKDRWFRKLVKLGWYEKGEYPFPEFDVIPH